MKKKTILIAWLTMTTLLLAWCWSIKKPTTKSSPKTTNTITTVHKKTTSIYGIKPIKQWNIYNSNFKEVKKEFKKKVWPFYVYINNYIYKKANKTFQNWDYFNLMYKWKTRYKTYFNQNWDVTKLEKIDYIPLTKQEYIAKLRKSPIYNKYVVYNDILNWKQIPNNTYSKIIMKQIALITKNIKERTKWKTTEIKNQIKSYINSQEYMLKSQLENMKYTQKVIEVKWFNKDFVKTLEYIKKQLNIK